MPGGDRTGPMGMGPMTGRGAGYCAGYAAPGYANPGFGRFGGSGGRGLGRGFGRGFGFGRGRSWGAAPAYAPAPYAGAAYGPTAEQEIDMLRQQARGAEQALKEIRERISDLESQNDD